MRKWKRNGNEEGCLCRIACSGFVHEMSRKSKSRKVKTHLERQAPLTAHLASDRHFLVHPHDNEPCPLLYY